MATPFELAFMQAYNAGLQRRWQDEREERKRQEEDATGKALYDLLQKDFEQRRLAGVTPAAQAVETAAAPMQGIDYAKLSGVASGDPDALAELAKLHAVQAATEKKLLPAAQNYNQAQTAYANPLEGMKNMPGSAFIKVLPTLLSLTENREAQYKQQQQQARAQAAIAEFQNAQTLDEKKAAALKYQLVTGKSIDSHFYTPQYKEVTPGSTLVDPATGKVIYAAPYVEKPMTAYERYKVENGLVGRGGASGGKPKLGKEEQWAQNYELGQRIKDEEILAQYEEAKNNQQPIGVQNGQIVMGIDPKLQKAANEASARMNQYWRISSGGKYQPWEPQQPAAQPVEPKSAQELVNYQQQQGAKWYDETWRAIKAKHPEASDEEIYQFMTDLIEGRVQ